MIGILQIHSDKDAVLNGLQAELLRSNALHRGVSCTYTSDCFRGSSFCESLLGDVAMEQSEFSQAMTLLVGNVHISVNGSQMERCKFSVQIPVSRLIYWPHVGLQ